MTRTPMISKSSQWCIFLRNHDELTLEMVTPEERDWMWAEYAPEPRMRLNLGIRRRLAPLLDNDRRRIELANSLLFTMPGTPIVYYGDEIGMGDNIWLPDRNGVRTPMQWSNTPNAGFSSAAPAQLYSPVIDTPPYDPAHVNVEEEMKDPDSLLNFISRLITITKAHLAFGEGDLNWARCENMSVAAYFRDYEDAEQPEHILIVQNLSCEAQDAVIDLPEWTSPGLLDLLSNQVFSVTPERTVEIHLEPYQFFWLEL
jgi:maltose alpha-D-glucosyltransferase/alpha-amylase